MQAQVSFDTDAGRLPEIKSVVLRPQLRSWPDAEYAKGARPIELRILAQESRADRPSFLRLAGGATTGFVVGAGALGAIGYLADRQASGGEVEFPIFTVPGVFIGGAVGTSLGAHLANGRRGSYWSNLFVTSLAQVAGIYVVRSLWRDQSQAFKVGGAYVVIVQAPIAAAVERATERRR